MLEEDHPDHNDDHQSAGRANGQSQEVHLREACCEEKHAGIKSGSKVQLTVTKAKDVMEVGSSFLSPLGIKYHPPLSTLGALGKSHCPFE